MAQPITAGFALSVSNAEMEVVKKITPEHIGAEVSNRHLREMRRFELDEKALDEELKEGERKHERDERDRRDRQETDGRLERMFYVVLVVIVGLAVVLILKGQTDLAIRMMGTFVVVLVTLLGGVGLERLRRDRHKRRDRARDEDDD